MISQRTHLKLRNCRGKMKPIYFPFTYISEPVAEALASCFRQTVIYQPSSRNMPEAIQKRAETDIFDIRIPVNEDEGKLDTFIKEYRRWAELHQGSGLSAFFSPGGNKIPFFDETSISQIRSDIRQHPTSDTQYPTSNTSDTLFNARVFLCIAQDFDMQNSELDNDLASYEKMEQDIMKNLRGEDSEFPVPGSLFPVPTDDPGNHKTEERIGAWIRLMQHDPEKSGMFVTSSQSVFDLMIDKAPDAEQVLCFDSVPIWGNSNADKAVPWQENLARHLDMLAENTWPVSADRVEVSASDDDRRTISLTVWLAPGKTPDEFFGCYVENETFQAGNEGGKYKNTLLGLISV